MLNKNLFDSVLLDPVKAGATQLYIVSGYATPAMVYKHLQTINDDLGVQIQVKLIIGMASLDGVGKSQHQQFQKISNQDYKEQFECWYVIKRPPVHAKTYAWFKGLTPRKAFTGSANYSQNGFFFQREAVALDNPKASYAYFNSLLRDCVNCLDPRVDQVINFTDAQIRRVRKIAREKPIIPRARIAPEILLEKPVRLSLLINRTGETPTRSGLNWGQRPGRDPNQSYIQVPTSISRSGFFPARKQHFTIITDDSETFDAVRAQDEDKAIETPFDNSLLGIYFRKRMGLKPGEYVNRADLEKYGRTDVDFIKIDDETYYMDFSVKRG